MKSSVVENVFMSHDELANGLEVRFHNQRVVVSPSTIDAIIGLLATQSSGIVIVRPAPKPRKRRRSQ